MNKKLPPLSSLVTFEAAARLNSFKLAADELHLTPAAIAYQVRKLEASLKIKLFDRYHKGVTLNTAGKHYLSTVTNLLDEFARQTQQFKHDHAKSTLTVLTLHAIAEKWLMPRLVDFHNKHPEINIEITATENLEMSSSSDIVIGFCMARSKKPASGVFLEEDIFPVCSHRYRKSLGSELEIGRLSEYDLLFDVHWKRDWNVWLAENNLQSEIDHKPGFSFSLYSMVIEAAVNGMGIMMGHQQLISRELQNGQLTRIFHNAVPARGYFYLHQNTQLTDNENVNEFASWISHQAQIVKDEL